MNKTLSKMESIKVIDVDEYNIDEIAKKISKMGKVFVAFLADWCTYCQIFKPDWEEVKESIRSSPKMIEGTILTVSDKHMDSLPIKQPSGFPSMSLYEDGEHKKDYVGPRNKESVMSFIKEHLSPKSKTSTKSKKDSMSLPNVVESIKNEASNIEKSASNVASNIEKSASNIASNIEKSASNIASNIEKSASKIKSNTLSKAKTAEEDEEGNIERYESIIRSMFGGKKNKTKKDKKKHGKKNKTKKHAKKYGKHTKGKKHVKTLKRKKKIKGKKHAKTLKNKK